MSLLVGILIVFIISSILIALLYFKDRFSKSSNDENNSNSSNNSSETNNSSASSDENELNSMNSLNALNAMSSLPIHHQPAAPLPPMPMKRSSDQPSDHSTEHSQSHSMSSSTSNSSNNSSKTGGKFDQSMIPRFKEFSFFNAKVSYAPASNQFSPSEMLRSVTSGGSGSLKSSDAPEMGLLRRGTDNRDELNSIVFAPRTSLFEEMNSSNENAMNEN